MQRTTGTRATTPTRRANEILEMIRNNPTRESLARLSELQRQEEREQQILREATERFTVVRGNPTAAALQGLVTHQKEISENKK